MQYDVDAEVEAAIFRIAQAFGVRTDKVAPIVDQYGIDYSLAALKVVESEMQSGYSPGSPLGYLISLLRKGVIQVQAKRSNEPDPEVERLRQRYERAQADPKQDTAKKRLNRVVLKPELQALYDEASR